MDLDFKKARQSFDSLPYKERIKSVLSLAKSTLSVIGKDHDIIKPWVRMAIYHSIMVTSFFGGIFFWQFEHYGYGFWAFFLSFVLFLYKHFYNNRQELRMSWIVYETIIGHDPSYKGSVAMSKELKSQTRKIAWLDILMSFVEKSKFFGGGFVKMIINLVVSGIEEVWDLANHYLLPSVAVDKMDITPAIKEMKKLKERVPESLMGIFGIDFLGKVVRHVTIPAYLILFIISAALGYFGTEFLPTTSINFNGEAVAFSWLPVVIAIWIAKLFGNIFERIVISVKVVYFTVFYTTITHPEHISNEMQEELMDYLKIDQIDEETSETPEPA